MIINFLMVWSVVERTKKNSENHNKLRTNTNYLIIRTSFFRYKIFI
jgi:hypothetical protein